MESIERDLYEEAFKKWHLVPARDVGNYGPAGTLRVLESDMGSGEYWAYFRDNLFAVNAFRMSFAREWTIRYRCTEHLCLGCYDEVSGVAQRRGAPLAPGAITVYLGGKTRSTKRGSRKAPLPRRRRSPSRQIIIGIICRVASAK